MGRETTAALKMQQSIEEKKAKRKAKKDPKAGALQAHRDDSRMGVDTTDWVCDDDEEEPTFHQESGEIQKIDREVETLDAMLQKASVTHGGNGQPAQVVADSSTAPGEASVPTYAPDEAMLPTAEQKKRKRPVKCLRMSSSPGASPQGDAHGNNARPWRALRKCPTKGARERRSKLHEAAR
ncbi:hypothetical protein N0V86_008785 [Didymella sp. IMI 355093]|nr:hypothetical protein N0V86_008785 [Didymella sp. IMI 355093]